MIILKSKYNYMETNYYIIIPAVILAIIILIIATPSDYPQPIQKQSNETCMRQVSLEQRNNTTCGCMRIE